MNQRSIARGPMMPEISNRNERVARFLGSQIVAGKYPGLQYIVVEARQRLFEFYGGFADFGLRVPMEASTTMMAYSMTKTFTAAALLQLVESGKVALDETVVHYLPSFPYGSRITVRQLISQTSGIPNPMPLRWAHPASAGCSFDESAELRRVMAANPRLAFAAGSRYGYSNISYWILGKIIEQASGLTYARYMRERVFAPLGLDATEASFLIVDPARQAKGYLAKRSLMNLLKGFLIDGELVGDYEGRWLHIRDHYLNGPAFGGLIATSRGISVFLQDQLKDRSLLMDPDTKSLFYEQQSTTNGKPVPMTPGWHIGRLDARQYYFKEGGGGGYHCAMRIYPARGIATVIMTNETSPSCIRTQDAADREFLY